jgi:caffeoyl-CoA O-methyltransferase
VVPLVDERLAAYAEAHTTKRNVLFEELRMATLEKTTAPQMQVGAVEGTLLQMLVASLGARRILEVGCFTGYSALAMAEALPDDGKLVTCDRDPEATAIAQSFFDRSPHGKKIEIRLGDALATIAALEADFVPDLAFIDADKANYLAYYEAILPRLRPGGLLIADNTLWSGRVLDPQSADDHGICAFNDRVAADPRVTTVQLSVRDGVTLARKLSGLGA